MDLPPSDPSRILPHRGSALLVDRIAGIVPGRVAAGWKVLTAAECRGGRPWPRVLMVEVMAQTSAALLFPTGGDPHGVGGANPTTGLLAGVPEMNFKRDAYPGETVVAYAELERRWGGLARFKVRAHVGGELAAEGALLLAARVGS